MFPLLSLLGFSSIINPFTLIFRSTEINTSFMKQHFLPFNHIISSILAMLLSLVTSILSIIIYNKDPNRLNNLRLFIGLLFLVFLILNLLLILNGQKCQIQPNIILIYSSTVNICCFRFHFYLLESITKYEFPSVYITVSNFLWIIECFFEYGYIMFIDNTFLLHFVCHCVLLLFIFVLETFCTQGVQLSFILLCSFAHAVLVCCACYVNDRQEKVRYFDMFMRFKDFDDLKEILNYDVLVSVTFQHDLLYSFNKNLLTLIESTQYKDELDALISKHPNIDSDKAKNDSFLKEISVLMQKLLFNKIIIKNDNLMFLIKEQLLSVQKDNTNFDIRMNGIFSMIRENKLSFQKLFYIGVTNFESSFNTHYSVFIHVDQVSNNIVFFALGLDFPVEVEQKLGTLNKVSLLNSKITHELKNPLAAIQTLVSEIKTFIGIQEVIFKLDTIYDYTEFMQYITKDFEYFALKIKNLTDKQTAMEVDIKRVRFEDIVNFSVNLIKHIWKNKNSKVFITQEVDPNINEYINTDEIRVKEIIINLLSNSMKFTKMGSVIVTCTNHDKDFISITVADTGIGMKEEHVNLLNTGDCLFLKDMGESNKMGSGLGLSIVKDMVKVLGKDFKVESQYNNGTRISFYLNKNIHHNATLLEQSMNVGVKTDTVINVDRGATAINNNINSSNNNNINSGNVANDNLNWNGNGKATNNNNNNNVNAGKQDNKGSKLTHISLQRVAGVSTLNISTNIVNNTTINHLSNSNTNFLVNNDLNSSKVLFEEETTKREEYVLLKPREVTPKNTKQYLTANTNDVNFMELSKKYSKAKTKKKRMTIRPKQTRTLVPTKTTNERDYTDNLTGTEKIYALVVEDEQVLRNANVNAITKYFKDKGVDISIDENTDGIECIYKIYKGFSKNKKYQFIVTDEIMGVMNGTWMTDIIRKLIDTQKFYPIKIYYSSGNILVDEDITDKYEGIFPKPLTQEYIAQIYNDIIDNKSSVV